MTVATKLYRDGNGSSFDAREWDESGLGLGPYSAMPVLSDGAGGRLSRAEDSAHVSGDHGLMALVVRKDTVTALAGTDGDYIPPIVDKRGRLHVSDGSGDYVTVAASQTDKVLGTSTNATIGDFLHHLVIVPGTTSPGAVSIKDGSGSSISIFVGGTTTVQPWVVEIKAYSTGGAWSVSTGTNVTVLAVGNFR